MAKLVKFIKRTAVLRAESGIKINGMSVEIGPGGLDSTVVKNPLTGKPYIPGSSLKGKMRHMLERKYDAKNTQGASNVSNKGVYMPCGCGKKSCMICTLFGAHMNMNAECGPGRLKVHDLNLTEKFSKMDNEKLLEGRAETMIDRKTGTAAGGSLRQVERTSSGLEFKLELIVEVYQGDDEDKLMSTLDEALKMVEMSGLGGSTSRGYGQVSIHDIKDEDIKA